MAMNNQHFIVQKGLVEVLQRPSAWVLIAVNLGLIAGVIVWDWKVFDIVFLYWVENLVIGVINVLKMITAKPASGTDPGQKRLHQIKPGRGGTTKLFLIPFFIVHYGMFCFGHGVFIFFLFADDKMAAGDQGALGAWDLLTGGMLLAIGLLAASHLFSFLRNFIAAGEFRRTHPAALMTRPYGRIIALHITIIFGAFLTEALGSPLGLLVILMVLKTSVDLAMHQAERQKLASPLSKPESS
jgi:hypothetical protein